MSNSLLVDIGSTYTKVTAVDLKDEVIMGTARAFTTIHTSVNEGLANAIKALEDKIGKKTYDLKLGCSSAAGGLKMVTSGLVKDLTAKASEMAALNAGGKVLKVYAFNLTDEDIEEIRVLEPEIILLAGGIDGGNKKVIIQNAIKIANSDLKATVIIAGNKDARKEIKECFEQKKVQYVVCDNVMPDYNVLQIEEARATIRKVFLEQIIEAKGLHQLKDDLDDHIMPTPSAVMLGMKILAFGWNGEEGIGPLIGVDVGGATTDIYSMAKQESYEGNTMLKGLPEPTEKRTVEGDLGLKYSVDSLYTRLPHSIKKNFDEEAMKEYLLRIKKDPSLLPTDYEKELENWLTYGAVKEAVNRHVGSIEITYTLDGPVKYQLGKDLTQIKKVVGTGGPIIDGMDTMNVLQGAIYTPSDENRLKPRSSDFYIDKKYIIAAMGLLSTHYPETALRILKKELVKIESDASR